MGYSSTSVGPLLLDLFPNARVAYSLRRLRTLYTGAAIRVRRSNDNAEQDIGFSGNDLDTAALLAFVGGVDGFVTTWYDQSGNGDNGTQTVLIAQPQVVSNGVVNISNAKECINFNGLQWLNISTINFATANYQSFVGKRNLSGQRLMALAGLDYLSALWSDNRYYLQNKTTGYLVSTSIDTTTNQLLITGLNDGTNQFQYKNSSLIASSFVSLSLATQINAIGRYRNFFQKTGNLQEIVFYNFDQSANRTGIETNINNYYNIYP